MNQQSKKPGLFFGTVMATFFIAENLLSKDHLNFRIIIISVISGLIGGAVAGLLFGWLMGLFIKSKFVNDTTKIDVDSDESILFQTGANHFKGIEGVGGKLYLTNKRLVFKSHKLNIQNHLLSICLSDIITVDRYKTLNIVNNGLSVTTNQGIIEKFVVEKIDEWVMQLEHIKNGYSVPDEVL